MMNSKGEWVKEEFEPKRYGTPFQYGRDVRNIADRFGDNIDGNIALAVKYFPHVFGKDRFVVEGLDKTIKFQQPNFSELPPSETVASNMGTPKGG